MKNLSFSLLFFIPFFLFQQNKFSYYKAGSLKFGMSAISEQTLNARTLTFNHPVYKIIPDTVSGQLIISVRQKDPTGRFYTSRGYHLTLKDNDSIIGVLEDNKLDLNLMGEFLILSNETRSGRFNRLHGYEQFEYPSKIIYTFNKNNSGLTYNPSFKIDNETGLSSIDLNDGKVLWSAPIFANYNWNDMAFLNDSTMIIAAGGLHAINVNRGLLWSYTLTTATKITKPLTYSSFNRNTFDKLSKPLQTTKDDAQVTQITSNILASGDVIYFVSKDKMLAVSAAGKLIWEVDMSAKPISNCMLFNHDDHILLINPGVAMYGDNIIQYGKPYIWAYNKQTGAMVVEKNEEALVNMVDIEPMKKGMLLANRNKIIEINEVMGVQTILELAEPKFGKFLEFINGDEYYVEKEGFYVPLNFINDNVVYFKTDHGKVFGLNKNEIEYEYHYTELYKFNKAVGNKKLISQKNKTILVSSNNELLYTFNSGEPAIVLKDKIYFTEGRLLYTVNVNELK